MQMLEVGVAPVKRKWRVGTLSMGISLITVGLTLLISAWQGVAMFDTLLKLWPVIFVLLGCEILIFVFLSGREKPVLHYDLFSIFFVSFLCVFCLFFSLVTSTGLMDEIRHTLKTQIITKDLPDLQVKVPNEVEQILVQTYNMNLKVDKNANKEIHLLGTYQLDSSTQEIVKSEDIAKVQTIGKTMYVFIKEQTQKRGAFANYLSAYITLVVPQDIPIEVRDNYNHLLDKDGNFVQK
ncbi:MAG: hypothetical protein JWM44_3558 [Bacilli bacterium]|nr:hypothetical protein [Bacilli bacterium]